MFRCNYFTVPIKTGKSSTTSKYIITSILFCCLQAYINQTCSFLCCKFSCLCASSAHWDKRTCKGLHLSRPPPSMQAGTNGNSPRSCGNRGCWPVVGSCESILCPSASSSFFLRLACFLLKFFRFQLNKLNEETIVRYQVSKIK